MTPPSKTSTAEASSTDYSLTQGDNDLTVLIFKNNYSSRAFKVPLKWISQFGVLIGLILCLFSVSSILAVRSYIKLHRLNSSSIERELNDIRTQLTETKARLAAQQVISSTSTTSPAQPVTSEGMPFQGYFPPNIEAKLPETPPIRIEDPVFRWTAKGYKVQFNLTYIKEDGGSQRGRIFVVGRGPNEILGYPEGIFSDSGKLPLISPDQGERFMVSRLRETTAMLGPVMTPLKSIEVMVIGDGNQLLAYGNYPAPPQKRAKTPEKSQDDGTTQDEESSSAPSAQQPPSPVNPEPNESNQ